jgi:hypothetical protein
VAPEQITTTQIYAETSLLGMSENLYTSSYWETLVLRRSPVPIEEPVTKFGGLPVWVGEPAWPTPVATGQKMLFIGQVVIDKRLFPVEEHRLAYLFITEEDDETVGQLETWNPSSGENAVIIQKVGTGLR